MAVSKEIYIGSPLVDGGFLTSGLSRIGRRALRLRALRGLRRTMRRVLSVSEPLGRLAYRPCPVDGTNESCAEACRGLSVLSSNIWHDIPRYRQLSERLESFAKLVQTVRPDILLVQEVLRRPGLWVDEWLSERLDMGYVYSRANGNVDGIGFEEGLAVFSRFPIHSPHLARLGVGKSPFFRRAALGAAVETPCGRLLAFSAQLGLPRRENAAQLAHLRRWVSELAGDLPAVIGGDFNAYEGSREIVKTQAAWLDTFRCLYPHADGVTHELRLFGNLLRRSRLDYIFLHNGGTHWRVIETRHLQGSDSPHSDHKAVLTRLEPVFD